MTERKFGRRVIVTSGDLRLSSPEVTIEGRIPFSDSWVDDVGTLRIHNIDDATVSRIRTNGRLRIEAGYENETGLIQEGVVRSIDSTVDKGERIVTVRIGTGMRDIQQTFVSRTYRGRVSPEQLVEDIIGPIDGVEVGNLRFPNRFYPNKMFSSSAFSALLDVARDFDRVIYLSSLQLFVETEDFSDASRRVWQSPDNGLQSAPKVMDRDIDGQTYRTASRLMHQVRAGSTVELDHPNVSGTFRAVSGSHNLTDFTTFSTLREAA